MAHPSPTPPGPGQESVWDYPRPPRLELSDDHVVVVAGGIEVADSRRAWRVLETSSPPVYYLPTDDVVAGCLVAADRETWCEWKGAASYFDVAAGGHTVKNGAWTYRRPAPSFTAIADHVAFYAGKMDACYVDDEQVQPQPGDFYGGWVTSRIVGPFKGDPGTLFW